jgi:type I restriction enzyme, S subunit
MNAWTKTPFETLLVDSKDGEWGEGDAAVGLSEALIIRGTDFPYLNNPGVEFPRRWVKEHIVERKRLQPGDLILETAGGTSTQSTGRSVVLTKSFFVNYPELPVLCASFSRHLRLDTENFSPRFTYYLLQALYRTGYMAMFNIQHTGVSRFQYTAFKNHTELQIPDLPVQRKNAAILSAYDELIENNRRRIALLEKLAEEIYREWFVRLRFPGHEKMKKVKGVPTGWQVQELKEVATEAGKSTKPGTHLAERFYLPLELLFTKQMLPAGRADYTEAQSSLATFEKNDFLFGAMRPYQHKVAIAPFPGITRTTCFVIRPKIPQAWSWLFLTLFQPASVDYASLICNGSDRPYAVWNKGMERMKLLRPDDALLEMFETIARPILDSIVSMFFVQEKLTTCRDKLLPRLISGKLPVENLAIQFPPGMAEELNAVPAAHS